MWIQCFCSALVFVASNACAEIHFEDLHRKCSNRRISLSVRRGFGIKTIMLYACDDDATTASAGADVV